MKPAKQEPIKRIQDGMIGDIILACAYWNGATPWVRQREEKMTEMEYQMRNWYYFNWLVRRPHRGTAHPQPGRHQLDHERRSNDRPGPGRLRKSAKARTTAKRSIITSLSSNIRPGR
jgi:hypothetical protein